MALFLVQEAENEFRGTPRQRGPKWGHFWGSIFGQKGVILGPLFDPLPLYLPPKPEMGGFRGGPFWGPKNGTFSDMSKMSLFGV